MGLDFMYIKSFHSKGLGVWAYGLKALSWVGCGAIQGVKKGGGVGMIVSARISSGVKGSNLRASTSSSEGCLSIYYFIWGSSSTKSLCS